VASTPEVFLRTALCHLLGIEHRIMPVQRFASLPPNCDASGDVDSMSLLAGQGVGLVREVKPADQIVHELVEEARQIISRRLADVLSDL
jgi:NAD(P)H-dependent flavin oxidoreductase YrpB (nitropropane dioxygenase family)